MRFWQPCVDDIASSCFLIEGTTIIRLDTIYHFAGHGNKQNKKLVLNSEDFLITGIDYLSFIWKTYSNKGSYIFLKQPV